MRLLVFASVRRVLLLFALVVGMGVISPGSAWASANCPNEQFRTGLSANLPDCRAYEQVSPQEKNGGGVDGGLAVLTVDGPNQAALNGESVTYGSQTAFSGADPQSALLTSQYLSKRTPAGWVTAAITPKQELENGKVTLSPGSVDYTLFQGFGPSLEYGFLAAGDPAPVESAPAGYTMPYTRNSINGKYTLLSEMTPPVVAPLSATCCRGLHTKYAGMSADGNRVIFEANDALAPEALPGQENLYEWNEGVLEVVNRLPDGTVYNGEFRYGAEGNLARDYTNALSRDGKRAFWSTNGLEGQVYMHEITPGGPRTVDISATQKTNGSGSEGHDPNGTKQAQYWAASAQGTLVYLTSPEQLTNEAGATYQPLHMPPNGTTDEGDLYQYNVETGKLTDLTPEGGLPGERADVQGVIGASEDGSYVYFAADGVLANGAVRISPVGGVQNTNIYVWHEGEIKLVGTTDPRNTYENFEEMSWGARTANNVARVSPNGRYLAFMSTSKFGVNDNGPAFPGVCDASSIDETIQIYVRFSTEEGKRCMETYVYDAHASKLICASCQPGGLPATGNSYVPHGINLEPRVGWQNEVYQQRYLSNSGRVFFDSTAALVPQDANGQEDVYEWEPAGVGGCTGASSCVNLVSGGDSSRESAFLDADEEGNNAFFVTFDRLTAGDGDENEDLYDAPIDGGLTAPVAPPCQGEACRSAISIAPSIYGAPASQTFNGTGNPHVAPPAPTSVKKNKDKSVEAQRSARALRRCEKMKHAQQRRRCRQRVRSKFAKNARTERRNVTSGNGRGM